jgi:hypothetical protein
MAMCTYLQMVSAVDLAKLREQPTWINKLDRPGEQSFMTYHCCSINYFLTGDAYPSGSPKQPLGGVLFGFSSVSCSTLENGNFGVLDPQHTESVLRALGAVDIAAVRQRVEDADPEALADDEVDDFELLEEGDEPPADVIVSEIERLLAFYKYAARHHYGVVNYTT